MDSKSYKPGQEAPRSGQYRIRGTDVERTVTKGEPFPPTPQRGQRFKLADATKHRRG